MNETSAPNLPRKIGSFPATNLVVANMIGAGIFTTSGLLMQELGSPMAMMALWVAGGVLALCGALCFGALGAAMPRAGGEYVFLSEQFHPVFGFLTGWVSFFVGFSAPLAASSLGFSEYLGRAFPGLIDWADPVAVKRAVAVLVISCLTLVHLRGIEFGSRVQNVLTAGKVLLIAGLVAIGFLAGNGSGGHFTGGSGLAFDGQGWKTVGLSLMWIMFAYSGWNASVYIGSEIREPRRTLPRSLIVGTGIVMLLYCALNLLYVYAVPPQEMSGVIAVAGLTGSRLFGPSAGSVVSLLIAFALLSSISALIILGPRVYYAMAKDGYFFKVVSHIHPTFRVPSNAIVLQCLIAIVLVMSGTFDQILTYMGFALGIFPILTVLGVFKLRRSILARSALYPAAIVFASTSVVMLVLAFLERPVESTIALATVGAGVPAYVAFSRSRAAHAARSSTPEVEE
jgi:APA family basic amino acid/polyamine antiporter